MSHKNSDKRRAYKKAWAKKNKSKTKNYSKNWRNKIKTWYLELKSNGFCVICGEGRSAVLELHHRLPSEKTFSIYEGVKRGISLKRLQLEVAKCSFLCNKCHRLLHTDALTDWEKKQWRRHIEDLESGES